MNVKLIAIDIDGTLLRDDFTISARTKQVLRKVKEQSVPIVLASGRGVGSCLPLSAELGIQDPIIAHNGAVIYDTKREESLMELGFSMREMIDLIQYCRQHQIHYDVSTTSGVYLDQRRKQSEVIYNKFFIQPRWVDDCLTLNEQAVKITLSGTAEQLDRVFYDLYPLQGQQRMIRSGEMFIDITHPQATKGYALQTLLQLLDISVKDVIAFGNYYNDLEIISISGMGVAMKNSPHEVLDQADRVAPTNNDDGVACVLEEMMLSDCHHIRK